MKAKKVLAMLMASAMIMGTSVTAFAAGTSTTAAEIVGIELENPEAVTNPGLDVTVTAYQIITYDEKGKYNEVLEDSITKNSKGEYTPTADDLAKLSKRTTELTTSETFTRSGDSTTFTCDDLTEGSWMVLVTDSESYFYNPMIISVYKDTNGVKQYGTMDLANDKWTDETAYAKKSEPDIVKTALTPDVQGVQYGDIIQFQVTADIPDYTSVAENITYSITDTVDGLQLYKDESHSVVATVNGSGEDATLNAAVENAFISGNSSFTVTDLGDEWLKTHGGEKIVITYYAKVTTDAKLTVDETTNTATLDYSTNDDIQQKEDDTIHYTFGIDTTISGQIGTQDKTGEFVKIDSDGTVRYDETTGELVVSEDDALSGAKFKLYIGDPSENKLFTNAAGKSEFETTNDGKLEITGLDSDVTYYLVETKAPDGYTINETPVPVMIDAEYDEEGLLLNYAVVIGDSATGGSATTHYKYEDGTTEMINTPGTANNPYGFKNSTLTNLPSTGGIGTTVFTIGGCVVMVTAAGLYFATRKKTEK